MTTATAIFFHPDQIDGEGRDSSLPKCEQPVWSCRVFQIASDLIG